MPADNRRKYAWCFTINHKDSEQEDIIYETFDKIGVNLMKLYNIHQLKYAIYETERGESGRLHIQGFIRFYTLKAMDQVKEILTRQDAHLEESRATDKENKEYCSKDHKEKKIWCRWNEIGILSVGQGHRSDYDEFVADLQDGATIDDLYERHSRIMIQNHAGAMAAIEHYMELPERDKSEVYVYYGSSGSGKTTMAMLGHPKKECYFVTISNNNNLWFNGYNIKKHKVVVLDEFGYQIASIDKLKQLLDQFLNQVEKKGGMLAFNPPCITITSQRSPLHWFREAPSREDMIALLRRMKRISKLTGMWLFKNVKEEVIKQDESEDPVMVMQKLENMEL